MALKVSGTNTAAWANAAIGSWLCAPKSNKCATLITPTTSSKEARHTGYQECAPLPAPRPAKRRQSSTLAEASSHCTSLRGVISEVSGRSSKRNTFCTIWCSCSSISPASTPSSRLAEISSSVTARAVLVSIRKSLSVAAVVPESNLTKGLAACASHNMGRATQQAMVSGCNWPMRLGTSSPKIMVVKVMTVTTKAVAVSAAALSAMPRATSQAATPSLNAASPTMPLSTPMEVMPTCTVDKNWLGLLSS